MGSNLACSDCDGVWISLTQYSESNLPNHTRHAHVNPHLTLLLQGGTSEKREREEYERKTGELVFFHAGEPHQNSKTVSGSKNINFEFEPAFLTRYAVTETMIEDAVLRNPKGKFLLLKAYSELMIEDAFSAGSLNMLILDFLYYSKKEKKASAKNSFPAWVEKIRELLHDKWNEPVSLRDLSLAADVHAITISKHFPLYFSCTLGEYKRRLKVEKALAMIKSSSASLLEIAHECGFADQSHFIRTFNEITGFLPGDFRKL